MGSSNAKPTVNNEIIPFIPYICISTKNSVSVDPSVVLNVRSSLLDTSFINGYNRGLFSEKFINKGTIICETHTEISKMMNDAMVNLEPVINCRTSAQLYVALNNMKTTYYDLIKADNIINTVMLGSPNGSFFQAIKDIEPGSELLRMYGFSTWTFEIFDILTSYNIAGFTKFISELKDNLTGDPYETRVKNLHSVLTGLFPNAYNMTLDQYDNKAKSESFKYVGKNIEKSYSLFIGTESIL